jgi:hypothetical protein
MKNLLILFVVALSCQGCFTYRNVDASKTELNVGGKYKIKQDRKTMRARLIAVSDSTLVVKYRGDTIAVRKSEIRELKAGKFSWAKTILFPIGIYVALGVILFVGLAATW